MRSRFVWLIPFFLLLISVIGSANAYAHSSASSGLEAATAEHQALDEGIQSSIQASVASAGESGGPCDCPGGHCICNVDCLAMCAATAAIADIVAFDLFPARSMIALEKMNFAARWVPNTDLDPPRPIA